MPAADASLAQDPSMAQQPTNQTMGGVEPMGQTVATPQQDPSMLGAAQEEPATVDNQDLGGELQDVDGDMSQEELDDSTNSLIAQLEPKDREAVRAYIISMLDGKGGENNTPTEQEPTAEPTDMETQPQQMAEIRNAIFSKKQLDEIFREKGSVKQKTDKVLDKHKGNNSPWASPKMDK